MTKLCMVIGHPVRHSLSPMIHNAGYKALSIDDQFSYVARDVDPDKIGDFVNDVRAEGIRGVSCTVPHKQLVIPYLDKVDPVAQKIGAVNTIVNDSGKLTGYNTDWLGAIGPIRKLAAVKGKKALVVGAGGTARAVVYGLTQAGAIVTVCNRTAEKSQKLAQEFGCDSAELADDLIQKADIIINTTTVGMNSKETPLYTDKLHTGQIVFDAVYSPYQTELLRRAKQKGSTVIHGTEMLLAQAYGQFKLYTGQDAPVEPMRQALMKEARP